MEEETLTNQEVDLIKEEENPEPMFVLSLYKVGDVNKDGFKVISVRPDGKLLVSNKNAAKVVSQDEF